MIMRNMKKRSCIKIIVYVICLAIAAASTAYAGTWVQEADKWKYENEDSTWQSNGWFKDSNGKSYYFDENGYMIADTMTPDGYYVGADGVWDGKAQIQQPLRSVKSSKSDIYYKGLRAVLDDIPLYPVDSTGDAELDALLNNIFAQILTDDMDTHDKLKVCYDYLIHNMQYGYNSVFGDVYASAYGALKYGQGVCDDYSAAFAVMARKIGVPVYTAAGKTHSSNGNFTGHAWCQLDYNGITYIFDPQVEDVIFNSHGYIMYIRFGGTTTQLADKYQFQRVQCDFSEKATKAADRLNLNDMQEWNEDDFLDWLRSL